MGAWITELYESLLRALLRTLLPARGRHRAPAAGAPPDRPPVAAPRPVHHRCRPIDAGQYVWDTPLVRPYLLTPEARRERQSQRRRRRALWLAVHGVDIGPRRIHGVEVPV
ncbi:hypothetical protein ACFY93_31690 [Streptomyces sp. NPDC008313]|uniref:hypothetical protein n=1 Tax=Streptomyces sp. NPDC008313 TaxID=3364826 RepID=UPI0036E2571D